MIAHTITEYSIHFVQFLMRHTKAIERMKDNPNMPINSGQYFTNNYFTTVSGVDIIGTLFSLNTSFETTK